MFEFAVHVTTSIRMPKCRERQVSQIHGSQQFRRRALANRSEHSVLALCKTRCKPPSPWLCRRQKGVRRWLVGLSFRFPRDHGQSLSLFSYTGKQTKPICLPGKGCSGLCRKASIGRRFLVSRSNLGVLFCLERHPGRMSLDLKLSLKPIRPNTDLFSRRF